MVATGLATESHPLGSTDVLRRFAPPMHRTSFWVALWAVTVAAVVVTVMLPGIAGAQDAKERAAAGAIAGAFAGCGLIAWRRRPDSRSGLWMVATGFGLFVGPLLAGFQSPTVQEFNDVLDDFWAIAIIALLLTFMSGGRLERTADRVLVGAMGIVVILQFVRELFLAHDGNFLLVHPDRAAVNALETTFGLLAVFACLGTVGVIGVRFKRASAPQRRAMLPSVAGISALLLAALAQPSSTWNLVTWLVLAALLLVPAVFLASMLHSRLARGDLNRLFGELPMLRGTELQARLAAAVGDPSLVVAYARDGAYADSDGVPVSLPPAAGRSVAQLDGAALLYDSSLDQDPGLIEAVSSATAIALEHQRLRDESQASRQRVIAAGDAERRRLERNLHDGAQQRLTMLAFQLRLIQDDIHRDPAGAEALVTNASAELAQSLDELRELARGIHPAVLEHGLPQALTSLAARSAVPTAVSCDPTGEVPSAVELALYFVACEALANVAKYAHATAGSIRLLRRDSGVAIEIADDGVGGARATAGSGLTGLQDRVEALGGRLIVTSPERAGTVITAEVPCES